VLRGPAVALGSGAGEEATDDSPRLTESGNSPFAPVIEGEQNFFKPWCSPNCDHVTAGPHEARDDLDWYLRHVLPFPKASEEGRIIVAAQKATGFADFAAQTIAEAKQTVRALA